MPVLTRTPYYQRKIQCPGHYMIPPKVDVYLREPVPELKDCSNIVHWKDKPYKINKWRIVKDRWGRKVIDWKKIYDLANKGIILRPWVTSSWAIEHVYDPLGVLCRACDKRCMEGKGKVNEFTIKRLHQ